MITIEPLGGLANRMRVIASGIGLSQKLSKQLTIIWNVNYELKCPYHLLFENNPAIVITRKQRKFNYIHSSAQPTSAKRIIAKIVNKVIGIDYCVRDAEFYNLIINNQLNIYETAKSNHQTYIQTCQEFGDNLFAYQYFEPVFLIRERVAAITVQFTNHTIGVHIRRTDHTNAIKYSPVELFIKRMEAELALENKTTFFLCTDDPEVEQSIVTVFGEKVITHKKEYSRQSVKGMEDAVVDMFCLSKTTRILGSYWSSFSEVAAKLTHIELEVLKTPG